MSDKEHIAIVRISAELLLDWLQFEGGEIKDAKMNFFVAGGVLDLIISHPDMPEAPMPSAAYQMVTPAYIEERDSEGHLIAIRRVKDGG